MFLSKLFAFVEAKAFKRYMFIEEQGTDDGEAPRERLGGLEEETLNAILSHSIYLLIFMMGDASVAQQLSICL